jgi:hypothetical protein
LTSQQIIADFLESLPQETRFPAINRFLSLFVKRNVDTLSQPTMEQLIVTIEPVDELSVEALSLLEHRLFEIYEICP